MRREEDIWEVSPEHPPGPEARGERHEGDPLELLRRSVETVERHLEQHRRLVHMVADGEDGPEVSCLNLDCPHRRKLNQTLWEVISVLEKTRRAFKSKQLAALKRRLLRTLAEME